MRKQVDLYSELKTAILETCVVIEEDDLNEWLKNLLKEFYNRNNKKFLNLTETETEALRRKYCDAQFNTVIAREFGIKSMPEFLRRTKRAITKRAILMYRLHLHNDAFLDQADLLVRTVEELNRVGLKKISDITRLNEREFQIIIGLLPEKMQLEVRKMLEKNNLKLEGPEIVIEEDDVFIDELDLSKTTVKCLFWSGIRTKSQIFNLSEMSMKKLLGIGNKEQVELRKLFKSENRRPEKVKEDDFTLNENTPIEILNLSLRSHQALCRNNIKTLGELLNTPAERLIVMSGIGHKSYGEIIERLKYLGYAIPEQQRRIRNYEVREKTDSIEKSYDQEASMRYYKRLMKKKEEK